ncbi:MFS transporter [Sphingomonas prati]|uniref:MFS family permease n=1 Tax=Sphingomonas prati TaxID=1843237 RepID=A0A7W9F242_9SPHN|nr:MFS transporter [Sphingomonas prati]MBB5730112.1 MFS family permease [Sphingomonas prati]GGE91574.1 2-acyl-glycerophospho-ethanolamine acyltransferase [Sphingomonas prati]
MTPSFRLLAERRFLPLFVTQFLGAFNDNLFRTAMIMLVTFEVLKDPTAEASFSAVAGGLFILPFFLLSALSGQLADGRDKAKIVRLVKSVEIAIMVFGAAGLLLANIPLMLAALFAMGVHSTFFGPIKYAILPQHLESDEVLGGTGLVEAGSYGAILLGTIVGGIVPAHIAAVLVLIVAVLGRIAGQKVPAAPSENPDVRIDFHILRASIRLVRDTMHIRRLFLAITAISFFWMQGAILAAQFPPLVKNALSANQSVATLFLSIFSIGVAVGSIIINRLLKGAVSARFAPAAAILMGLFVCDLYWTVAHWPPTDGTLLDLRSFVALPHADRVLIDLFGVAVAGGMFVVPLYAFLTTTVPKAQTARTVAANNIVNAGAMVFATVMLAGLVHFGVSIAGTLLLVAVMSIGAALLAYRLHLACDRHAADLRAAALRD